MNLLKEGIEQHLVIKTASTRKLTVDGITKTYPVYKIKLNCLFYNDQNDRIATWISQFRAQHDGNTPDISDREAYNRIIEGFIVASNPDAIRKTQTNIELVDQREAGVVLTDGRIIDGNRRFTCLRRLSEKNDRFSYFEAVILDRSIESSAKQIKMLELSIQHGEESKVDYNVVDRLVGVYHDIIETGLLSVEEYARSTNETTTDVEKRIEIVQLMVEFLEFINAPRQFYIARDLQVAFPLEELSKLLKKCKTEEEKERLKTTVFTNILMQTTGDMVRFIRSFKAILGTDYQEAFLDEQQGIAEKVIDILPDVGKVTTEAIREDIRTNDELTQELSMSFEKNLTKVKKNETRNRPAQLVGKATSFLDGIDINILQKLSDGEYKRFCHELELLEQKIAEIREQM